MNDLDSCLEVVQGHVNHCGINSSFLSLSVNICLENGSRYG